MILTLATTYWGTLATGVVVGNDELGLVTITTGATVPTSPAGIAITLTTEAYYNKASVLPSALLMPTSPAAAALGSSTFNITIGFNVMEIIANGTPTLAPNTIYQWVYHLPKQ